MKDLSNLLAKYFSVPVNRRRPAPTPDQLKYRAAQSAASRKVRKLLEQHPSITVERDDGDFWVYCSRFEDDENDPLHGMHFASSWEEVLDSVQVYIDALSA